MEVDHEAMNRAAAAKPEAAQPASDPAASAPEMVETSTAPVSMSHRSGAVPDQYESYPEVVTPEQITPYAQSSVSAVSPAQTPGAYDRYQTISPPPAQQNQPLMQQQSYFQGPIPVESEQKGYYGPTLGVSQPTTPYSNTTTIPGQGPGSSHGQALPDGKLGSLPPPTGYPTLEKKILGMRKKVFWIVLVVVILVIAGAAGGAAGAIISKNNKNNGDGNNSNSGNNDNTDAGDALTPTDRNNTGSNGAFTPYALTTGVRTLQLTYFENAGSCNIPTNPGSGGLVDCNQSSRYQVRIDGSVEDGYTISSVDVQGNSFSNVAGIPPTTDDPNALGSTWLFEVRFTQGGGDYCEADRITRYVFGANDSEYAVGEVFTLTDSCALVDGNTFSTGTSCTCVAIGS